MKMQEKVVQDRRPILGPESLDHTPDQDPGQG